MNRFNDNKTALLIFCVTLIIYLWTSSLRIDSGDGETMFKVADSLSSGKGFAISVSPETADRYGAWGRLEPLETFRGGDGYGAWGKDGKYYAKYGLGWSLLAVPFCRIGKQLAPYLDGFTPEYTARAAVMLVNPILMAASCSVLFLLSRRFYSRQISMMLTVLFGFGSIAWYYSKSAFSEPLVTLLVLLAVHWIYRNKYLLAGIALGYSLLTRQTALFLVLPLMAWGIFRMVHEADRKRAIHATWLVAAAVLGQVSVFWFNMVRFGDPLNYGYLTAQWDTPFWLGLYSLLFSSGKGLMIFTPVILLGLFGIFINLKPEISKLVLLLFIADLLPHAFYSDWGGGGGWGSRLLLPLIPLLLLPAGTVIETWQKKKVGRFILLGLFACSIFIQVLGVAVNWSRHLQRVADTSASPPQYFERVHYRWQDSPIVGQVQSLREVVSIACDTQKREALAKMVEEERDSGAPDWQVSAQFRLSLNLPDFWWIYVGYLKAK